MASAIVPAISAAVPIAVEVVKSLKSLASMSSNSKSSKMKKKTKKSKKAKAADAVFSKESVDAVKHAVNETSGVPVLEQDETSAPVLAHSAPFAQGTTTHSSFVVAKEHASPHSRSFDHSTAVDTVEYVEEVRILPGYLRGDTIAEFFLHPRTINGSRLDLMARNYTHYWIEHVEVVYEPIVAATTPGALCIGIIEDPKLSFVQGEKGLRQLLETRDAVMFPIWQVQTLNHSMCERVAPLVTRVGGSDLNFIFQGKLVVKAASDYTSNLAAGNLILKYRIHFYGSYLSQDVSPVVEYDNAQILVTTLAPGYFSEGDVGVFLGSPTVTPAYENTRPYSRINALTVSAPFPARIGSSAEAPVYIIPPGRMLYTRNWPSYSPLNVRTTLGPLYLTLDAALLGGGGMRLTSTTGAGSILANATVTLIDLDMEYTSISYSALQAERYHEACNRETALDVAPRRDKITLATEGLIKLQQDELQDDTLFLHDARPAPKLTVNQSSSSAEKVNGQPRTVIKLTSEESRAYHERLDPRLK